ncbi:MAG: radical SAM protein [Acidobacteriota bacterium]|nr:radical SAM protein [Acidobacteriota bacterium]
MKKQTLNIAQICPVTEALGPGRRFVLWVQGCPFSCRGCISPDWIEQRSANQVEVSELAAYIVELAQSEKLEGITISGGEPMLQASALARLLRLVRAVRQEFTAISFSGFTLAQLRKKSLTDDGVADLLASLDVLIDGLYVEKQNDGKGLRGSRNQQIHFLTPRYEHLAKTFNDASRRAEVHLLGIRGEMLLVGVPSPQMLADFHLAAGKLLGEKEARS